MTKTIAVFGAAGRTGRVFVQAALQAGYQVRAGIHTSTLPEDKNLVSIRCNLNDARQVAEVLKGCDAVVSLLGHRHGSPASLQADAMRTITGEMKKLHIRRLLSLTGTGVRMPGDAVGLIDRLANIAIALIDPKRVSDGVAHVDVLRRSELDWTVIRVLKLTDGNLQPFLLTANGPAKMLVSRQTVAAALLRELEEERFIRGLPIISAGK